MSNRRPGPSKGQKHSHVRRSPFGERLFRVRKARGLTQERLGEEIGVSKRVIASYEGTRGGPPPEALGKMAKALAVSVDQLLGQKPLTTVAAGIKPSLRKHLDAVEALPPKDQKKVMEYADLLAKASEQA